MFGTEHDGEMTEFESALGSLRPAPSRADRDALMFRAGRVSAGNRRGYWPLATAATGIAAVLLGAMLLARPAAPPAPPDVAHVVHVPAEAPPAPTATGPTRREPGNRLREDSYLRLRQIALGQGVDALPEPEGGGARPDSERLGDVLEGMRILHRPGASFSGNRGGKT
jgi:hypothetical protein